MICTGFINVAHPSAFSGFLPPSEIEEYR